MEQIQVERLQMLKGMVKMQGHDIVPVLEQLLGLSKSSVYQRMKGETTLTLTEVLRIIDHFDLPTDYFTSVSGRPYVSFSFAALQTQPSSITEYLEPIRENLKRLAHLDKPHILYASNEIPIFNYFLFPELAYFKLYVWGRTIWEIPDFKKHAFDPSLIVNHTQGTIQDQIHEIHQGYQRIPSTEYWSQNVVDNTVNQINLFRDSHLFADPGMADMLKGQMRDLIAHLDTQTGEGFKNKETKSEFQLYHNEISHTNNNILVMDGDTPRQVFITFDNPNFMISIHPHFLDYTTNWFQKLTRGSTLLTEVNPRFRTRFFDRLMHRVDSETRLRHEV